MPDLRQLTRTMTPKGWAMIGAAAAAAIAFLYILSSVAGAPSYSTMLTGLDPATTGKMTTALDAKGIAYELQNNGTALAVASGQTGQARIALASGGLLTSGQQPGMALFDKQQLGQSNFQQQITYQRALEGQLQNTIDSIQGVTSSQVQLVLPDPQRQLFADNSQQATAAVLLQDSGTIDPGAVKGIAQLVASSVPGLQAGKVTITDSTGALLWPAGSSAAPGAAGGASDKQSVQAQYDGQLAAQVGAMLAQTLGPGKAQVMVNADLNADQTTADTLTYANKGVPLTQHAETENLTGSGAGGAAGVAGTTAIPAYASTGTTGGAQRYQHKVTDTTLGVNKTVQHTVVAPGRVNRQSVSVLFDKSVPAAQVASLKAAVAAAVGLVPARGDTISTATVAFAKPATAGAPASPMKMLGYAKYVVIGLGGLLFLFFTTRMLKRREHEAFAGSPTWLRELEEPRSLAALQSGGGVTQGLDGSPQVMRLQPPVNVAKRQVEDLVDREPDRVAAQVRAWMAED